MKIKTSHIAISLALLTSSGYQVATAQDKANNESARRELDMVLEELVVTAQKRSQALTDVALAVSAFDQRTLEEAAVVNTQDLAQLVPNLFIPNESPSGATNGFVFLRGIGTDNSQYTLDPAVGIYYDGAYFARAYGTIFDLFDVERVEVLRGPQGTLYGRNNSAGAIRIISKKANLDEFDFSARAGFGSFDEVRGDFSLSAPLVQDSLGARLSVTHRENDGVQENTLNPDDRAQSVDFTGVNASLLWQASDTLELTFRYNKFSDRGDAVQNVPFSDTTLRTFESNLENLNEVDNEGVSATINWQFNNSVQLTSMSSLRQVDLDARFNLDGVAAPEFEATDQAISSEYFTQELYLVGDSIGSAQIDWVAGVFYYDEDITEAATTSFGADVFGPGSPAFDAIADRDFLSTSSSVYAQATFPISNTLSATTGARWTQDEKDFKERFSNTDVSFEDDNVTWKVGLDYNTDNLLLYASASTGFRSGGFDINSASEFPTEEVLTYEVGMKKTLFTNRMDLSTNYFYTQYDSLQQSITSADNQFGLDTVTLDADSQGLELELKLIATQNLSLFTVLGTLDTSVDGLPGFDLKQSPELSYRVGANYHSDLASGAKVVLAASYSYTDEFFVDVANRAERKTDSTGLVDARLSYSTPNETWEFAIIGKNLTDEDEPPFRFFFGFPGLSAQFSQFARTPRTVGATITYRY